MVYIALLRGINIGNTNKMDMKQLKHTFERIGLTDVVTYINTGNIVFTDSTQTVQQLRDKIEKAIYVDFELEIKTLVFTSDEIKIIMDNLPTYWTNDKDMKSDVIFLWEEINNQSILEKIDINPEVDQVIYVNGALLWSCERANTSESKYNKFMGSNLYKQTTVRNVNTARKIAELIEVVAKNYSE